MSTPYHDGYAGDVPGYHEYDYNRQSLQPPPRSSRRNNNNGRIPRPPPPHQYPVNPDYTSAPSGRPDQRRTQQHYYSPHDQDYPPDHAWEALPNMQRSHGYQEDYGAGDNYDQWASRTDHRDPYARINDSSRGPPQRLYRPNDLPLRPDHLQPIHDQPRSNTHVVNAARPHLNTPHNVHHGSGHWNGEGYSYAPPNHPPPNRPPPLNPDRTQGPSPIPQYPPSQGPPQAAYTRFNQRAPLGPPPSSRRGPATYYPDVGPVHPIVEETDSMRSSMRNGSVRTGGHDSKTSFASSNAIPIGIQQTYLESRNSPRPSSTEHGAIPEHVYETSDDAGHVQDSVVPPDRDQESPEVMVRQASVGKKSRPTLTEVRSGMSSGKSSDSGQGVATFSSQPSRKSSRESELAAEATERSRALAKEQLEGQVRARASNEDLVRYRGSSPVVSEAATPLAMPQSKHAYGTKTPEEVLKSGTGLIEQFDSSDSEGELRRKKSKELLGTAITNELHPPRSHPRSPLAPRDDDRVQSILESLKKGGAISAEDVRELKKPVDVRPEKGTKHRPPRLDVEAVRAAEARGSLTSLPDLIKRATKLASNLDRGKTASRLGMDWFTGLDENEKRYSGSRGSLSDALNSFPLPQTATPTPVSRNELRRSVLSGKNRHSVLGSDSDAGQPTKQKRRCCGIPLWAFMLLSLLLLLLIAAAVVLPVVFVVLPNQNKSNDSGSVGSCNTVLTCENGGANIVSSNGSCECICRNGYYGKTCSENAAQGCTTTSIGTTNDASIGDAIPRLLQDSQSNFSIPLDGQDILGLFSTSDLSCVSQNALVTFNSEASKRSVEVASQVEARSPEKATVTSEGILFATGSPTASAATTAVSTGSTPSSTSAADTSQLDFARVAVLYVFQASGSLDTAVTAQENLQSFFRDPQNAIPSDLALGGNYTCNLDSYTINVGNGTIVGGGGAATDVSSR